VVNINKKHSPLHVAESFKVLEALHPGRIDLGIGRAPGTDALTAMALRRSAESAGAEDFPAQLMDLIHLGGEGLPPEHPFHGVRAEPLDVPLPPIWMLGSSDYGARVAAALGTGFAFARHMNPRGAEAAMGLYRDGFRPSPALPEPRAILALSAVCADDGERARELAMSLALGVVRMRAGRPGPLPSPEEALAHEYSAHEQEQVRRYLRAQVLGGPAEVADQIGALAAAAAADEVMIMTSVHDHGARLASYERIAAALGAP
jgi:luciferase family oxidoreductase group 1